jgi:Agarase CBM like domain/Beta-galactosidase
MHRSLLATFVILLSMFSITCTRQETSQATGLKLFSFESAEEISGIKFSGARAETVADHVTDGKAALQVVFEPGERSGFDIVPANGAWDWEGYDTLAIDITNLSDAEVSFGIRIDDDPAATQADHSTAGRTTVSPRRSLTCALPFGSNSSMAKGMRGGPAVPGIEPYTSLRMEPQINEAHIAALHVYVDRPASERTLILDNIRLLPPTSYQKIVDPYGQYTRMDWPGKVKGDSDFGRQHAEEEAAIKAAPVLPDRDEYGGWAKGPQEKATGFFRTLERDGKWWLVTPSGHLYLSLGVDVLMVSDGFTIVENREGMFSWLPGKDDPLARHFSYTDKVLYGPAKKGRMFNFYSANLERKYGTDYVAAWRRVSLDRLQAWGFTTVANWSEPEFYAMKRVPYTATLDLSGDYARVASGQDYWGKMHDPFDPKFAAAVDKSILEKIAPYRNDPWCVGYFIDNEISWGSTGSDRQHLGLVYGTLEGGKDSPAKGAFIELLKKRYRKIEGLNKSWGTTLASWEEFLAQPFKPEGDLAGPMREDFTEFLTAFARQYFRVIHDAQKRQDPNHLYLGCRFAWRTPEAVAAAAEYCDVVSFNIYRSRVDPAEWDFTKSLKKPCIIGEFHFGAVDRGMFHTGLVSTPTQAARAEMYKDYIHSVVDNPAFVGCAWFQYFDEPLVGRIYDGENYNIGFVDVTDTPYPEMVAAAKSVHAEAYTRRFGPR